MLIALLRKLELHVPRSGDVSSSPSFSWLLLPFLYGGLPSTTRDAAETLKQYKQDLQLFYFWPPNLQFYLLSPLLPSSHTTPSYYAFFN